MQIVFFFWSGSNNKRDDKGAEILYVHVWTCEATLRVKNVHSPGDLFVQRRKMPDHKMRWEILVIVVAYIYAIFNVWSHCWPGITAQCGHSVSSPNSFNNSLSYFWRSRVYIYIFFCAVLLIRWHYDHKYLLAQLHCTVRIHSTHWLQRKSFGTRDYSFSFRQFVQRIEA